MIQAAIFDIGGVLIDSPKLAISEEVQTELGLDKDAIDQIWSELIPLLGRGEIDEAEFWGKITQQYACRNVHMDENLLGRAFMETLKLNEELLEFVREMGQNGIKLAILSNTIEAHSKPLRETGMFDTFDYVFLSHEIGIRKPDPAIFRHVMDMIECEPADTLFIDDDAENVDAAKKAGLQGLVAESPLQVMEALSYQL